MNILYIGSSGALSLIPFNQLLASKFNISAVAAFKPVTFENKVIALQSESLALAANQSNIPVIDLSQPVNQLQRLVNEYAIDIIIMSCYSKRLPDELINIPAYGCYNMHPSLLPEFRGPEPVFWQMKQGARIGVSWHQVVHDFDAGDIAVQQKVLLDDGLSFSEVNIALAEQGAELMLELLSELIAGKEKLTPQNPEAASYYPYPENHDFVIDVNHSARQIYNFMKATRVFACSYLYQSGHMQFALDEALDFDINLNLEVAEIQGSKIYIPCNEGVLIATYTDKIRV